MASGGLRPTMMLNIQECRTTPTTKGYPALKVNSASSFRSLTLLEKEEA